MASEKKHKDNAARPKEKKQKLDDVPSQTQDRDARIKVLEAEFGVASGVLTSGDIAKTREYLCLLGMLEKDPNIMFSMDMDRCTGGGIAAKRGEYYAVKNSFFQYRTGQAALSPNPAYAAANPGPANANYTNLTMLFEWVSYLVF